MRTRRTLPLGRVAAALAVITPISFVIAIPWLKAQPDPVVFMVTAIAVAAMVLASTIVTTRTFGDLDEWQRAGVHVAIRWGGIIGSGIAVIAVALPFVQRKVAIAASALSGAATDVTTTTLAFTAGVCAVIMLQTVATMIMLFAWRIRMARPARTDT